MRETGRRLVRRRAPEHELSPRSAEAMALPTLLAGHDAESVEGSDGADGQRRTAKWVAEGPVISTVDSDAQHAHKTCTSPGRVQAHLAVESDTGIVTGWALITVIGIDHHESRRQPGAARRGGRHPDEPVTVVD